MRPVSRAFVLICLLALGGTGAATAASAATPASAAETVATPGIAAAQVGVVLAPATLAVGDPVEATLTLTLAAADAAREVTFPDWSEGWGEAEVLQASPVEKTTVPGGVQLVQRLRLTAWKSGRTALPPVEVQLAGEPAGSATTPADLGLEVRSVLAADDKELQPAPPAPPRALAIPRSFWWTLAAGAALVALAAVLAWKSRPGVDPLAAPELSPLAELERALGLLAAESPAAAFAHLSQALRRYLGRRLEFRALESTTSEVQRRLATLRLEPALVQRAARLLRLSDQIKFARRPAEQAEAAARIAEARELAGEVEVHMAPVVPVVPDVAVVEEALPPSASRSGAGGRGSAA